MLETLKMLGHAARMTGQVLSERVVPPPRRAGPGYVPASAEMIRKPWLTSVLCGGVPGAEVTDVRLTGGHDGTTARRALRVSYNEAGTAAGLPTALFSKSTATIASRLLLGVTEVVRGEVEFYEVVRPELDLRSPRAFYAGFDRRSSRSLILLEDLAAAGWTFPEPLRDPVTKADALDMVGQLARFHGPLWNSSRFETDLRGLRDAYGWQRNLGGKAPFAKRTLAGLRRAEHVLPAELRGRLPEVYPALMRSLELHQRGPRTLLHQDTHLGNWMRDPQGRMGLYDWQCAAIGNWALDFGYTLSCALEVEDRREWAPELLTAYLDGLRQQGVADPPSFDEAWLMYRQHTLHALVFGSFTLGAGPLEPMLQPRDYTIAMIGREAAQAVDLDTLGALG